MPPGLLASLIYYIDKLGVLYSVHSSPPAESSRSIRSRVKYLWKDNRRADSEDHSNLPQYMFHGY